MPGLVLALAVLAGCAVPTGDAPTAIPASDIPYGLADPTPSARPTDTARTMADPSRIFLVAANETLVPVAREVDGGTAEERLGNLLDDLAAGPTGEERGEQLSTALPPEVQLRVDSVVDGTATVDIAAEADAPSGWASRRAVAQIVLTATSVPGVDAVLLTLGGDPVDAPLPAGELTADPLTADDYAELLTPGPLPAPTATPGPTAGPAPSAVPAPPS
jgi:hypothetical protein